MLCFLVQLFPGIHIKVSNMDIDCMCSVHRLTHFFFTEMSSTISSQGEQTSWATT